MGVSSFEGAPLVGCKAEHKRKRGHIADEHNKLRSHRLVRGFRPLHSACPSSSQALAGEDVLAPVRALGVGFGAT